MMGSWDKEDAALVLSLSVFDQLNPQRVARWMTGIHGQSH